MELLKPREDGLSAVFYQRFWDICKGDVIQFIKDCFDSGIILAGLNATLIALVPKCPNPLSMVDLRPIGLCNTLYKSNRFFPPQLQGVFLTFMIQ